MENKCEVKAVVLGPDAGEQREIKVLNRIVRVDQEGWHYELADPAKPPRDGSVGRTSPPGSEATAAVVVSLMSVDGDAAPMVSSRCDASTLRLAVF